MLGGDELVELLRRQVVLRGQEGLDDGVALLGPAQAATVEVGLERLAMRLARRHGLLPGGAPPRSRARGSSVYPGYEGIRQEGRVRR
jgi:hypothetical protein